MDTTKVDKATSEAAEKRRVGQKIADEKEMVKRAARRGCVFGFEGAKIPEQGKKSKEDFTATYGNLDDPDSKPHSQSNGAEENASKAKPAVVDPIRMFGILVPPALRSAQTSFREAVNGPVLKLTEVTGELKVLEREIGRTRKSIRKA